MYLGHIHSYPGLQGHFLPNTVGGCWPPPPPTPLMLTRRACSLSRTTILYFPVATSYLASSVSTSVGREAPLTPAQTLSSQDHFLLSEG